MQDLYGHQATFLDAVHGFVATASPLVRGRHLLDSDIWADWEQCNVSPTQSNAPQVVMNLKLTSVYISTRRKSLRVPRSCSSVICLAEFSSIAIDDLLIAAGDAIWATGPLIKGSNLCHGTGGNGYAFLKPCQRTRNPVWLERARAFAMHGIAQTNAAALHYGQMHYSLWTGDIGFAIYLWDCLRLQTIPQIDVFYGS